MKRHRHLMELIADPENLRLAFWKAAKSKRGKADCIRFQDGLDAELDGLRRELLAGDVRVGDYRLFTIHDPKERVICAAAFRERVLHHALMNVCEPILERAAIADSYACRKGMGQLAAVRRALGFVDRWDGRKTEDGGQRTDWRGRWHRAGGGGDRGAARAEKVSSQSRIRYHRHPV